MEVKQKKVFISGKITGDPNYREKFDKAEKELTEKGFLVMNPAIFPEGFTWDQYMKITLAMLDACDTIYLMEDWAESRGAQAEFKHAIEQGKCIMLKVPANGSQEPTPAL